MRVWEAGIVMARVLRRLHNKDFAEEIGVDTTIVAELLELGSGTAIGILPLINEPWQNLKIITTSDHLDKLVNL